MDDSVQIRCTRCKGVFRDRARRLQPGYSRQCPNCEVIIFFEEGAIDRNVQLALRDAKRLRRALRVAEEIHLRDVRRRDRIQQPLPLLLKQLSLWRVRARNVTHIRLRFVRRIDLLFDLRCERVGRFLFLAGLEGLARRVEPFPGGLALHLHQRGSLRGLARFALGGGSLAYRIRLFDFSTRERRLNLF